MDINQIKPSKVKLALLLKDNYHLGEGDIVKVYWNKNRKQYVTLTNEYTPQNEPVIGNFALKEDEIKIIAKETHPESFL